MKEQQTEKIDVFRRGKKSHLAKGSFHFLLISVTLFILGCGNGKTDKKNTPVDSEKNGVVKIEFLSEMHNFGTLKDGETVSFSFVFKNNGNKPVKIKQVLRSCDCITVRYQDTEISPGENSDIEVVLKTAGEWGNLLKTLEVQTSAGEKKLLTVSAYIENDQFNNLLKKEK